MEIQQIKENLSLATILDNYGLQPNKSNMLLCPFHEDKTASLQVNLEKNFYKCHACDKKGDQIQFVQDYEKITKRGAIMKCIAMIIQSSAFTAPSPKPKKESPKPTAQNPEHIAFLEKMFQSFRKGIFNSNPAKDYCKSRNLDIEALQIGFNGGQFHHGTRRDETLINNCLETGLLLDRNITSKTGEKAYNVFGNKCLVFPLRNKENQVVSFYFRSIINEKDAKHFYLKNRSGLYPNYPNPRTKKLILTESIIDAASLIQALGLEQSAYSIIACYGTNGLNEEIQKAILELKELEEIIFCFDTDIAGKTATSRYANELLIINDKLLISKIDLPNKDINETLQLHEAAIFTELLNQRKPLNVSYSPEASGEDNTTEIANPIIEESQNKTINKSSNLNAIDFLKQRNLLQEINILIEKSGIIGEENSRLLLFIIASSYKTKQPLHAIVQGSSGSGKTHLISKIADLMPQEDTLRFTRITESSLYNWGEYDLVGKHLIIEDLDGLKEEAMFAMRELISNQRLSSSVSVKDKKGNIKSTKKEVKGVFSSLSATTKGDLYEDNMSRSFLLAVDESEAQTNRIITYQNKRIAGEISEKEQEKAKLLLQQIMRILKNEEVQNPFATQIQLPENVQKKRRLNEMFQSIIKQITIINQYQRNSQNGKIQTQIEDVEQAVEILFESIILKIDELDGSLRQFFEKLKKKFQDYDFTRFEAMETTGFKKTQLQHYINQLVQLEYIKQFGHGNKGYKYKISYFDDIQNVRKKLKEHFKKQLEQLRPNTNEH
jgi:DNA primase